MKLRLSSFALFVALAGTLPVVGQTAKPEETPKSSTTKAPSYRLVPPPTNYSPPALSVDNADFDWGIVMQGELIEHTFKITNTGGAPLVIERIKPSCGCTTVAKPEKPIEPGQSDTVTLQIDSKRLPPKTKKTASIFSNDPSSPTKISMAGNVDRLFEMEPLVPRLSTVRGKNPDPVKVTLKRPDGKSPAKIVELTTKGKLLAAELVETEAGKSYEILLTANVNDPSRKFFQETVEYKVSSGGKEFTIPVPVSITVKDRIHVEPRTSVYFNGKETKTLKEEGSKPLQKELTIKSLGNDDHTFAITSVENKGTSFQTKLETIKPGKEYRLLISLPKLPEDSRQRRINEKIFLKTDDPTVPELKVTALAAIK
jgi:hypothetical protein